MDKPENWAKGRTENSQLIKTPTEEHVHIELHTYTEGRFAWNSRTQFEFQRVSVLCAREMYSRTIEAVLSGG